MQEERRTPAEQPESTAAARRRSLRPAVAAIVDGVVRALRDAPQRPLRNATGLALFSLLAYAVVRHFVGTSMVDMIVYRAEGAAVANGQDLYGFRVTQWNLPATYPPFAAMLFVPITWFSVSFLRVAITLGNLALLGLLAHLSFRLVGWPRRELRPIGIILVVGLGVWLEPIFTNLRYGQINLALACLILHDLTKPDHRRFKGIAIGIAAGIKLTPGLFTVYLLLTGRVRAAVVSGLTFAATFVLGAAVLPDATRGFWTTYLWDPSRVGKTEIVDNQSLRGSFARLLHTVNPGLAASLTAALVAVAGLAIANWAYRSDRWLPRADAWAVCTAAVTAVLISPISWTHHWVWCVPMLVLLAAEAAHERSRPAAVRRLRWRVILGLTAVGFLSFAMWTQPHKGLLNLHFSPLQQIPTSIYPIIGLCFLAAASLRIRARRRAAGEPLVRLPRPRGRAVDAEPAEPAEPAAEAAGVRGVRRAPAAR